MFRIKKHFLFSSWSLGPAPRQRMDKAKKKGGGGGGGGGRQTNDILSDDVKATNNEKCVETKHMHTTSHMHRNTAVLSHSNIRSFPMHIIITMIQTLYVNNKNIFPFILVVILGVRKKQISLQAAAARKKINVCHIDAAPYGVLGTKTPDALSKSIQRHLPFDLLTTPYLDASEKKEKKRRYSPSIFCRLATLFSLSFRAITYVFNELYD
ncbi:hypothetical protein ACJX0J_027907, partial [Zea mays]